MPIACAASSASAILDAEIEEAGRFHRPAADRVVQRLAVEEFHGDEAPALVLADFVNRADVRMVERGGRARFALEPRRRLRVGRERRRQELERDLPAQARVFRAEDDAHTALADAIEDPVVTGVLHALIIAERAGFDYLMILRFVGGRGGLPFQPSCTTSKSSAVRPWKAGFRTPLSQRGSIVPLTYMSDPLSATMSP